MMLVLGFILGFLLAFVPRTLTEIGFTFRRERPEPLSEEQRRRNEQRLRDTLNFMTYTGYGTQDDEPKL